MRLLFLMLSKRIKKYNFISSKWQKEAANSFWLAADSIFRMLIGLIIGIWVARYLGPANFGELSYAIALVGMFGVIAGLGIDNNIVRDLVKEPDSKREILGTASILKFIGSVVAIVLGLNIATLLLSTRTQTLSLVVILSAGILFLFMETITLWFQSKTQSKHIVIAKNIVYLVGALIRIGLIINGASVVFFGYAVLIEAICIALALLYVYFRFENLYPTSWTVNWSRAKVMLREGWPLLLSSVSSMLYLRLDMFMLGGISGDEAVGIYGAATRLSEGWYFIPMAIVSSLQPRLVNAREQGLSYFHAQMLRLYILMSALSIFISILMIIFSSSLVDLLYGDHYMEAASVLAVHACASIAVFLGVASSQYLIIENLQKISLYRTTLGLICNGLLNMLLIPKLGAVGAAIATLVSYSVATFSILLFPQARPQAILMLKSLNPTLWLKMINKG